MKELGPTIELQRNPIDNPISRLNAIYMCSQNDFSCQVVKQYKFVYAVKPLTPVTKHDNTWLGVLQYRQTRSKYSDATHETRIDRLIREKLVEAKYASYKETDDELIMNYWSHKHSLTPCWEYLTEQLQIIDLIS